MVFFLILFVQKKKDKKNRKKNMGRKSEMFDK